MPITTKYVCDRCGHTDETKLGEHERPFYRLGIAWQPLGASFQPMQSRPPLDAKLWCRSCMVKVGVIKPNDSSHEKALAPATPPTLGEQLDELIREIVVDEMERGV